MSFGKKLAKYRTRSGMTQRTLAKQLGIHYHHLWQIENDRVNPPKVTTIVRISETLHLSSEEVNDLLGEVVSQAKKRLKAKE